MCYQKFTGAFLVTLYLFFLRLFRITMKRRKTIGKLWITLIYKVFKINLQNRNLHFEIYGITEGILNIQRKG